jgi:hypothetical protein
VPSKAMAWCTWTGHEAPSNSWTYFKFLNPFRYEHTAMHGLHSVTNTDCFVNFTSQKVKNAMHTLVHDYRQTVIFFRNVLSIIALMMEAVCTSEMSVNIYLTTWQYIPEDSEFHSVVVSLFTILVLPLTFPKEMLCNICQSRQHCT